MSYFRSAEEPFIVAGPCSAETQAQVLDTAQALSKMPVQLFRAGVWKPRTRPGSFEGNGREALQWLRMVKTQYQLAVTTEVAKPEHIALALEYGIDVLWIGARTVVNPFHVQQLADALRGVNIPIMVKNPVNPDIDLWEGALERFERAGINHIAAIHRGFSAYQTASPFRNQPNWVIPIELKRRRPDLAIICDPSHITGNSSLVPEIAQKALDMGFNGLMIETHPTPDTAWTDAAQQITPDMLQQLLDSIVIRKPFTADMDKATQLEYLRQLMDSVDAEIIELLARRMELSRSMGLIKKECNMTAHIPDRWRDIVSSRSALAAGQQLSPEYILSIYEKIHDESIRKQLELLQENKIQQPTQP